MPIDPGDPRYQDLVNSQEYKNYQGSQNAQFASTLQKKAQSLLDSPPNYATPQDQGTIQGQQYGLDQLKGIISSNGLDPQTKAAFWQARAQGNDIAKQREGAIAQQQQMMGGGAANSGQQAALQQQAAQAGAQRASNADMQQAAYGAQRKQQAVMQYLMGQQGLGSQLFRNSGALNQFNQQNYQLLLAKEAADAQNRSSMLGGIANLGLGIAGLGANFLAPGSGAVLGGMKNYFANSGNNVAGWGDAGAGYT